MGQGDEKWGGFESYVFKLFEERKIDSEEFLALIQYFGRNRLALLYEEWLADKRKRKE